MLHQVVYISSATKAFEQDELERLLEKARKRNTQDGVTGMLLHDDFSFLQVLEGAPETIQRTLARIQRDSRHAGLTVVQDQPIVQRDFSDWSMAYGRCANVDFDRMRGARRLDPDFMRALVAKISQPVSKIFVRQFGAQANR